MRPAPTFRLVAALAALAASATGCGSSQPEGRVPGRVLTVYSSLPLQGATRPSAADVTAGERLALEQAGGRVGSYEIRLRVLDDSRPDAERWSPDVVAANARLAVQDPTTIAYLGEFDTAGSTVSLPILSRKGVLQVTPTDTFAGPTEAEGSVPGEPAKYYPTMNRTFGRVVPDDDVQARVLARWMKEEGVSRLLVAHDVSLYGASLGAEVARQAKRLGLELAPAVSVDPVAVAADPESLATAVRAAAPDGVLYSGVGVRSAAGVFRVLHSALPAVPLFGPGAFALPDFARSLGGAEETTRLTALSPLDRRKAARFARAFEARYRRPPGPAAAYGHEAMTLTLEALRRAGPRAAERHAVVAGFFASRRAASPFGPYAVRGSGATTLSGFARYRVRGGRVAPDR